jgi:hypothetical protein
MALSLESAGKVRQKTRALTLDPSVFLALKGFFHYWATSKGNPDLQLIPISDTNITGTDGVVAADVPAVVYVAYIKKGATATDSYFKLYDDITDDATTTDVRLSVGLLEANEEHLAIFPKGLTMATGIVATAHTNSGGATDSTAGDAGNGFLIIGAAGGN